MRGKRGRNKAVVCYLVLVNQGHGKSDIITVIPTRLFELILRMKGVGFGAIGADMNDICGGAWLCQ